MKTTIEKGDSVVVLEYTPTRRTEALVLTALGLLAIGSLLQAGRRDERVLT